MNIKNTDGNTTLSRAASSDHLSCVEYFISHGVDMNTQDNAGITALMRGASDSHQSFVECLVSHGADVNIQNNDCYTALMWAAHYILSSILCGVSCLVWSRCEYLK